MGKILKCLRSITDSYTRPPTPHSGGLPNQSSFKVPQNGGFRGQIEQQSRLLKHPLKKLFLPLLLLFFFLWLSPASWADVPELPAAIIDQSAPSGVNANAISSEKISQFVQAYLQVVALIDRREGELQGAETESDSLRIKEEIEAGAMSLIEAEGLTFQEYLQLLTLANVDPEFSDRIVAQLQTID